MSAPGAENAPDDAVSTFLRDEVASGRMPGASWWVEADSRVVSRGAVGWACLEPRREETSEETPYDLASLTKPLATSLLALLLEDDGHLDLDGPAADPLPELRGSPYASVSLLDLGRHRAGLPAWKPLYLDASDLDGYVRAIARTAVSRKRSASGDVPGDVASMTTG